MKKKDHSNLDVTRIKKYIHYFFKQKGIHPVWEVLFITNISKREISRAQLIIICWFTGSVSLTFNLPDDIMIVFVVITISIACLDADTPE